MRSNTDREWPARNATADIANAARSARGGVRPPALLAVTCAALLLASCDFLEAAAEFTFGEDNVPRVELDVDWPSVDEASGLSEEEIEGIPGMPESLDDATLAHLRGAMLANGSCEVIVSGEETELPDVEGLESLQIRVTACPTDGRCAAFCPDDFFGIRLQTDLSIIALNQEDKDKIQSALDAVNPDAVRQVRLQFFELQLFETVDGNRVPLNADFSEFTFGVANDEGRRLPLVTTSTYRLISPDTPQRFQLEPDDPVTEDLKSAVLEPGELELHLYHRLSVFEDELFDLRVSGGGIAIDVQPEFVISVLEVAGL